MRRGAGLQARTVELGDGVGEDGVFVVEVLVPAGPENRLAHPGQAEDEEECTDDHPQAVDGDVAYEWNTDDDDQDAEYQRCRARSSSAGRQPRLAPAAITIVSASTISTRLAPKTARTRTSVEEDCIPLLTLSPKSAARSAHPRVAVMAPVPVTPV